MEFKSSHVRTLATSLDEEGEEDGVAIADRTAVPLGPFPTRRPDTADAKSIESRVALRELAQGRIGYAEFARRIEGLDEGDLRVWVSELARDKGGAAMTDEQRDELVRHLVHDASPRGPSLDEASSDTRSQTLSALSALCEVLQTHRNPRHRDGLIRALACAPDWVFKDLQAALYRTGVSDDDFRASFRGCLLHLPVQEDIAQREIVTDDAQPELTAFSELDESIRQEHAHALNGRMDAVFPVELKSMRVQSLVVVALDCLVDMPADCAPERLTLGFASVGRAVHRRVDTPQALEAAWAGVEQVAQTRSPTHAAEATRGLASALLDARFREPGAEARRDVLRRGRACIALVAQRRGREHAAGMDAALRSAMQRHRPDRDLELDQRVYQASCSQTTADRAKPQSAVAEIESKHGHAGKRVRVGSEDAESRATADSKSQRASADVARRGGKLVDAALAVRTFSWDTRRRQFQVMGQWLLAQRKRDRAQALEQVLQHLYAGPACNCEPLLRAATRGLCRGLGGRQMSASLRDRIVDAAACQLREHPESAAAVVHEVATELDAWRDPATHGHGIAQSVCEPALSLHKDVRVRLFAALLEAGSISRETRDAVELQLSMTNLEDGSKKELLALLLSAD